jgi:hypothetical protein
MYQVKGSLPAGFTLLEVIMANNASPVACAGKKHCIITCTMSLFSAQVIFSGPPENNINTTGVLLAANKTNS